MNFNGEKSGFKKLYIKSQTDFRLRFYCISLAYIRLKRRTSQI